MKNLIAVFVFSLLAVFCSFIPMTARAATPEAPKCEPGKICLTNPLKNEETNATAIIGIVIKAALGVVGAVTLLMFVMGGSTWLMSAGNPEKVTAGSKTMMWAAIGLLLVFSSYVILDNLIKLMTVLVPYI